MNKELNRILLILIYVAILYVFKWMMGFEFAVILGLAWLNADNRLNDKVG